MIHIFIGTKAQLIKMAPIMLELQHRNVEYNFILSGQHKQTFQQLFDNFQLKQPDIILYTGRDITGIAQMFSWSLRLVIKCLRKRQQVWRGDRNGVVLNHGDTFSTLLGSILAKLAGLKTAHIESGLRSFNFFHPFPEELTRLCVFRLSDYLFCPNQWAVENVSNYRGVKVNTGANTLFDTLNIFRSLATDVSVGVPEKKYAVVSLHRFENIFKREQFEKIIALLENVARKHHLLFILHKPTEKKLHEYGLFEQLENNPSIELRERYDYFRFITLVNGAEFVITDGGSNQEECYYLGKPCLLMRASSERIDGIDFNTVISNYRSDIIESFVDDYAAYAKPMAELDHLPSKLIVDRLLAEETN